MKSIILTVGLLFVAETISKPSFRLDRSSTFPFLKTKEVIPIVEQTIFNDNQGTYSIDVLGGDGTHQKQVGSLKLVGKELVPQKSGSVSWTTPEGQALTLSYIADELGYRAFGNHLPVAPEIPEEIKQMLLTLPKLTEAELLDGFHDSENEKPRPPHHPPPFSPSAFSAPAPSSFSLSINSVPQQQQPTPMATPASVPAISVQPQPPQQISSGMSQTSITTGGVSLAEELAPAFEVEPVGFLPTQPASSISDSFSIIDAPLVAILGAPKKTSVKTGEFSIDSDNTRTLVRMGA